MKKWLFILASLFITACSSGGGGNNNTTVTQAATPLTTTCLDGTTNCNNGVYNQYYQYGWMAYPVNPYYSGGLNPYYYNGGNYRFCSCPTGYLPAYNGAMGLGCVRTNYVPSSAYQWNLGWGYSWSYRVGFAANFPVPTGNNLINFGQISNTQGYPANNCYSGLAQSCYVDQANSCGNGALCVATAGGSRLGVCSTTNSSGSGLR